ncbi:hypothetical protein Drorol1_Dr00002045 [Drosera rotundifolia]
MRRHGNGCIRFFTSSTHRTPPPPIPSWDPTRSLNLNHPTLHLLETTNSRTQFKQIIAQMMKNPDLITLTFPMSRLIHFSATSHPENLDLAITLFDHFTPNPNLFIYNTIISASSSSYCPSLAFRVFGDMLNRVWSDKNTVLSLVRACGCVFEAKMVHCFAIVNGFVGFVYVGNSLMKFYMVEGEVGIARKVFDRMPERDPVAFNIMIVEYAKRGCVVEAVEVFLRMVESGVESDEFTMLGLLVCCGQSGPVRIGKLVHGWIVRRSSVLESNLILGNALLDMYVKCKELGLARRVFDLMKERNAISWNTIIAGCAKVGELELASNFLYEMPKRDLVSWNSLVAGYAQQGDCSTIKRLLKEMMAENIKPDEWTTVNLMSAAAESGEFHLGISVHGWLVRMQKTVDVFLTSALIEMYSKCGKIQKAFRIFREATRKDVALWTAMISGFAFHGHGHRALDLFIEMQNSTMPNHVTLVAVLSACSHSGLVHEGLEIFDSMKEKYDIEPRMEHYGCLVDLLVRSGRLKHAMKIIENMPMKPGRSIWGSVLGACNGDESTVEIAKLASSELLKLEPEKEGGYVLLSNIYASCGKWAHSDEVREAMETQGVKKTAGSSSLVVDGVKHDFWAADTRHQRWPDVQSVLFHLQSQMSLRHEFFTELCGLC